MSKEQELKEMLKLYSKQDLWNRIQENQAMIYDLEAKLSESEKKAYSRGHSQRDIANEIKLNALREDVANKEKRIVELKQQLAECEEKKESYRLQNDEHHLQLLQFYSRLGVEAFGADIHEKALETLMIMKEQLEEKEKEISEYIKIVDDLHKQLSDKCDFCDKTKDQDKISFAVDILEELADCSNYINSKLGFESGSYVPEKSIRDKIKYLKGNKYE